MEKFENHQHSRNNFFGSAAILHQTLGVKYDIQWTLRHYDLVIGEWPLAGFKTVKVKPAFSVISTCH
jgi:hypothetical protein